MYVMYVHFAVLEKFLIFATGSVYPQPRSIHIKACEDDTIDDTIVAQTCSKTLMFPSNMSAGYQCRAIVESSFNTV